jgi:predicted RNA-binding Zn-ribbon protein involved in translation (DUF1610 family)
MADTTVDDCPRCGDNELRGFYERVGHDQVIICFTCEWTINAHAWISSWRYSK